MLLLVVITKQKERPRARSRRRSKGRRRLRLRWGEARHNARGRRGGKRQSSTRGGRWRGRADPAARTHPTSNGERKLGDARVDRPILLPHAFLQRSEALRSRPLLLGRSPVAVAAQTAAAAATANATAAARNAASTANSNAGARNAAAATASASAARNASAAAAARSAVAIAACRK